MFKYNVAILHNMIVIMSVTFSLYDKYFIYMVIKTVILSIDITLSLALPGEDYKVKYCSLMIYFVFSISGLVLCVYIIASDQM